MEMHALIKKKRSIADEEKGSWRYRFALTLDCEPFEVRSSQTSEVPIRRPFATINLGE
jgi:hypothetical protein